MPNFDSRRVKIVCTLGPATDNYEGVLRLAQSGMDVARFNFSHGTHDDHRKRFDWVRQASAECGKPIAVLQDLQGPKIRVRQFVAGQVELKAGAAFMLTVRDVEGTSEQASVSYPTFHQDVTPGSIVLLDDGNLSLRVVKVSGQDVHCEVVDGGVLKNNKGVNLPGSVLSVEAMTEKDKTDLIFGLELGVDYVALSFVQRPEDVKTLKDLIASQGKTTPVISKIEKPQAVDHIDEIVGLSDGIMIARGDLGVEMNVWEVPPIQKDVIELCNKLGKPVITATQMLESMVVNPRPTRAEATDVANAVLDGTDAVMLSAETASGQYPFAAVEHMQKIIATIEAKRTAPWQKRPIAVESTDAAVTAIGEAASLAAAVGAARIVCLTDTGHTAKIISRFRPPRAILAVSPSQAALRQLALYWGVWGVPTKGFGDNIDDAVQQVNVQLQQQGLVVSGDTVIYTAALPFTAHRDTNMLRIERI
jgi:pyruvate kinase